VTIVSGASGRQPSRRALIDAMRTLTRHSAAPVASEPVTVTVARRVEPGLEAQFETWASGILRAAADFDGFLGAGVLRPGQVGEDWHIVFRFSDPERLERWERSETRAQWLQRGERLMDLVGVHRTTGLETWFSLPGRTAPAPARWKMALVTVTAIVPLVVAMNLLVLPHLAAWPLLARTLVFSGVLTTLMTWVVMPRMTRWFQGFLYGRRRG
jgi:antibiotic biosynthesis monooxygenase (ABM) superfamily enzyme